MQQVWKEKKRLTATVDENTVPQLLKATDET